MPDYEGHVFNIIEGQAGLKTPFILSENTSQFTAGMNARNKLVPVGYPAACSGEGFIYDSVNPVLIRNESDPSILALKPYLAPMDSEGFEGFLNGDNTVV